MPSRYSFLYLCILITGIANTTVWSERELTLLALITITNIISLDVMYTRLRWAWKWGILGPADREHEQLCYVYCLFKCAHHTGGVPKYGNWYQSGNQAQHLPVGGWGAKGLYLGLQLGLCAHACDGDWAFTTLLNIPLFRPSFRLMMSSSVDDWVCMVAKYCVHRLFNSYSCK